MRLRVLQHKLIGFASGSNILFLPGGLNNLNRLTLFRCHESESIDVTVFKISIIQIRLSIGLRSPGLSLMEW